MTDRGADARTLRKDAAPGSRDDRRRLAYRVPEVAAMLGTSSKSLYGLAARQRLRVVRIGKRIFIPATELDRILGSK